jgi:hypothetical protein
LGYGGNLRHGRYMRNHGHLGHSRNLGYKREW